MVFLSPAGCGSFTGISRVAEMCPGFSPPQATLVTVASREIGFGLYSIYPHACFYLILATLQYFNRSSVFILHYHAFNPLPIFYLLLSNTNRRCANLPEMSARACDSIQR